jgi:hypothetical protein
LRSEPDISAHVPYIRDTMALGSSHYIHTKKATLTASQ